MKVLRVISHLTSMAFAVVLASCASSGPPAPASSTSVEVTGGGFMMNRKNPAAPFQEMISYKLREGAKVPAYGHVTFENPADSSKPIAKSVVFRKPGEEVTVECTPFPRISNNRRYWVVLDLYSDSAKTRKIDSIRQENEFSVPAPILSQLGFADKVD
jgi:hypothetical protein